MRVARTHGFEDTRVEEAPVPVLEPGDALVRIEACGLCGSDAMRWYVETKAPAVLGHEPAGVVVATGDGCRVEVGQRVFVHHHVSCGECRRCQRGLETNCALFRSSRLDPGGFAEFVRVPEENVIRDTLVLPADVSFEQATFIEPLACAVRAVDKLGIQDGDSVLIIGLGAMGLMNARLAKHRGAGLVLATELSAARGERAAAWGVDRVFDPRSDAFAREILELTGGGVDRVVVGPASNAALQQALDVSAPGATVCLFSPFAPEELANVSLNRLYFREITLVASYSCAAKETRQALDLIQSGVVSTEGLVTHRLSLEQVGPGILSTAAHGDDWLRAVVFPQQERDPAP